MCLKSRSASPWTESWSQFCPSLVCRLTSVIFDPSAVLPGEELEEASCIGGSLAVEEFWWMGGAWRASSASGVEREQRICGESEVWYVFILHSV